MTNNFSCKNACLLSKQILCSAKNDLFLQPSLTGQEKIIADAEKLEKDREEMESIGFMNRKGIEEVVGLRNETSEGKGGVSAGQGAHGETEDFSPSPLHLQLDRQILIYSDISPPPFPNAHMYMLYVLSIYFLN